MGKDFLKVLGKLWGRGQSQFRGVLGVKSPKISVFRGGDKGRILGDFPLYSLDQSGLQNVVFVQIFANIYTCSHDRISNPF